MSAPVKVVILGAGGHACVLVDTLRLRDEVEIVGILDKDPSRWKTEILGVPILGDDHLLRGLHIIPRFIKCQIPVQTVKDPQLKKGDVRHNQ